jgi:hypothetical protein
MIKQYAAHGRDVGRGVEWQLEEREETTEDAITIILRHNGSD